MFEYTRAGLTLNGLIAAVQEGNSQKAAVKLAKLVRFKPEHIVDNFLGNLKMYDKLGSTTVDSRKAAAIQAMELVEQVLPAVGDVLDLRMEQGKAIEQAITTDSKLSAPLTKEEEQARKDDLLQQAKIEAQNRKIDKWRRKRA